MDLDLEISANSSLEDIVNIIHNEAKLSIEVLLISIYNFDYMLENIGTISKIYIIFKK